MIVPAHDEEATIAGVVADFLGQQAVDEVVVVDNNCSDATAERAREAGGRVVEEREPGYGRALMRGLREASGDYLVLVEADGSFAGRDLEKLLCYLPDCAMVLGTRTTRQMVGQGANMDFTLRWGNVVAAKILELLWYVPHEPRLTDVGCTYRALHRRTFEIIAGPAPRTPGDRDSRPLRGPGRGPLAPFPGAGSGLAHRAQDVPDHLPQAAGAPSHPGSAGPPSGRPGPKVILRGVRDSGVPGGSEPG